DNTTKYLFEFENDTIIESVLMHYSYGASVCISTQAGCNMGCFFCASTIGGLMRDLSASEMLMQVYSIAKDAGVRISHVVLMGSGEPLQNLDEVLRFIKLITHPEGAGISGRKITLSTCGLTDKIYELSEKKLPLTLAISLHAPNDEIRQKIMPVAKKYPLPGLFAACEDYAKNTGRRITYEYALIKGINDSDKCAKELAQKLYGRLCHVNLIPINNVLERNLTKPSEKSIRAFADILEQRGIAVSIRRELGSDINAACGQLRRRHLSDKGGTL
ncbi:MAG: 23S rRNA (adenine(2503)-C(2))-methyltransferase RlmN, partial [Firmicutes bacterium]|nr:23S rRNA (adenine(2503)-C(2))-methyltransferase RlmN [Bacillota bacterium]